MGQTVYVDLFFMINFSMDFLCFFLLCELLGTKMSLPRTLLASCAGGIYANVALFIPTSGIWKILLDLCVCAFMCLIAFGVRSSVAVNTLVYIAISMTLGGFMTALFSLFNRAELPLSDINEDGISAWLLAILAIVSAATALAGGKFFRRRSARKYTELGIYFNGKTKKIPAFCDSGNLLCDPISGRPCIIVNADALKGIFPETLIRNAKKTPPDVLGLSEDIARRIRIIPAKTASGNGLMLAMRVNKITLGEGKGEREVNALIALCELGKNTDGCEALVPTELII